MLALDASLRYLAAVQPGVFSLGFASSRQSKQERPAVVTVSDKARDGQSKGQVKQGTGKARNSQKLLTPPPGCSCKTFLVADFSASKSSANFPRSDPHLFATMFPSLAAMWIFRLLEWAESLLVARLSRGARGVLEPVLLQMSETALRTASGNHGRPDIFVSTHFPAFNIVRLWRLTGGFLQKALENLARHSRNRRFVCWFHMQTFDDPDLWQPRGTEAHAQL